MSNVFCGFIDAGYLRAQGSRACGIPGGQAQLRASSSEQRRVFDGIAFTPGVQLRLGHLAERRTNRFQRPVELAMRSAATDLGINADALLAPFNRHWTWRPERQQKGVDTLITLDLVRLARRYGLSLEEER